LFSNTSPSYTLLTPIGGGDDEDGGLGVGVIVAIAVGAAVASLLAWMAISRSRASRDERE
jgi:hypothetical protein